MTHIRASRGPTGSLRVARVCFSIDELQHIESFHVDLLVRRVPFPKALDNFHIRLTCWKLNVSFACVMLILESGYLVPLLLSMHAKTIQSSSALQRFSSP